VQWSRGSLGTRLAIRVKENQRSTKIASGDRVNPPSLEVTVDERRIHALYNVVVQISNHGEIR
jgi:hypothetical protein